MFIAPKYSRITGFDQASSSLLVQEAFVMVMRKLFVDPNRSVFDLSGLTDDQIFEEIKQDYIEWGRYEELGEEGWRELVLMTKDYLRTFKVIVEEDNLNNESLDRNEYAKSSFTVDAKNSSPWPLKLLIAGLPKTRYAEEQDGGIVKAIKLLRLS